MAHWLMFKTYSSSHAISFALAREARLQRPAKKGMEHSTRKGLEKDASQQPVRSDPHCILRQIDRTTILQPSRIVAWIASSILRSMQ